MEDTAYRNMITEIRKAFLLFFVSSLKSYKKYINYEMRDDPNYEKYFLKNDFVALMPEDDR